MLMCLRLHDRMQAFVAFFFAIVIETDRECLTHVTAIQLRIINVSLLYNQQSRI